MWNRYKRQSILFNEVDNFASFLYNFNKLQQQFLLLVSNAGSLEVLGDLHQFTYLRFYLLVFGLEFLLILSGGGLEWCYDGVGGG